MGKNKLPIVDSITNREINTGAVNGRVRVQFSITHGVELTPAAARALARRLRLLAEQLDPTPTTGA